MAPRSSIARSVGTSLAYLQHGLDRFYEWGFRRLKDVGTAPVVSTPEHRGGILGRLQRLGKRTAGFLGTAGDTYFRTYENLKKHTPDDPNA